MFPVLLNNFSSVLRLRLGSLLHIEIDAHHLLLLLQTLVGYLLAQFTPAEVQSTQVSSAAAAPWHNSESVGAVHKLYNAKMAIF